MPKPIEIYTTPICPYCMRAKQLLQQKGADFREIDVMGDIDARGEMIRRANGRRTVPQIFVGDMHVGGSDDLYALEQAGKLDAMLAG